MNNMKLSHRLQGLVNALGDEITEILNGAMDRVTGRILLLEAKAGETESLVRRKQYLEKQRSEIEKVLNEVYADIGGRIRDQAVETASATPEIAGAMVQKAIPARFQITMGVPKLTKRQVAAWFESSQIEGIVLQRLSDKSWKRTPPPGSFGNPALRLSPGNPRRPPQNGFNRLLKLAVIPHRP